MAYSSITGAEHAPLQPSGRDAGVLGPSDNSDSGSDTIGTHEAHADSDAVGTGERGSVENDNGESGDILPDRIVRMGTGTDAIEDDLGALDDLTDLDAGNGSAEMDPDAEPDGETL